MYRAPTREDLKKEIMQERLQKIIARAGIASRRHAELLIASGQVRVNGRVVRELGTKADAAKDRIEAAGKVVETNAGRRVYIVLNKPPEVVSAWAARLHCAEQAAGSGVGDGGPGRAEDAAKLFARIAGARVPGGEFGVCGVGAGVFDE